MLTVPESVEANAQADSKCRCPSGSYAEQHACRVERTRMSAETKEPTRFDQYSFFTPKRCRMWQQTTTKSQWQCPRGCCGPKFPYMLTVVGGQVSNSEYENGATVQVHLVARDV